MSEVTDLRVKPDYDINNIKSYLQAEEVAAMEKLREALPTHFLDDEHCKMWVTDSTLCRFLRARNWNHAAALKMLTDTLEWRLEYKPHLITASDVKGELNNKGKMYRNGWDKYGRPILYMKPGFDNTGPSEREEKLKYLVYIMEKCALAAHQNGREKLLLIIDFKDNNSMANLSNMKTSKDVLDILQNYYPESLGKALIYNAPWAFSLFWNFISPFLEQVTKDKIQFVKKEAEFLEHVFEDELETTYGGKNSWKYNYEEHWDKEEQ